MKRSEVIAWLQANGGQKGQVKIEYVKMSNPKYKIGKDERQEIQGKQVTWEANNGQTLTVMDLGETEKVSDDTTPALVDITDGEPVYQVVGGGTPESKTPPRTPEKERDDQRLIQEKEANLRDPNSGRWETDAERKQREDLDAKNTRQQQIDQQNVTNTANDLSIRQQAEARAAAGQTHSQRIAEANLIINQNQADIQERTANQPRVLGTPTDENRSIAMFDPTTGSVVAQANPLYDEAKAKAKQMQEELALAIQMNKLTADQAAAQYTQWFKSNIEVPFMQASEARAQAAEKRAALEAVERKRQFAAQNQIQRAQLGQQAASTAINAEIGMLPHRVGPAFGEQMSSAITSLAQGGKMDGPAASAGVNFTADAFEYDAPDIKKIAKEATKAALKGVTPYDPGDEDIPTADYSGISMPTSATMGAAPQQTNFIDTNAMYQNWLNSRYAGPTP